MEIKTIVFVDPTPRLSGIYRITASDGTKYATKDAWIASLCKRAMDMRQQVEVWSGGGWFYRELSEVKLVPKLEVSA